MRLYFVCGGEPVCICNRSALKGCVYGPMLTCRFTTHARFDGDDDSEDAMQLTNWYQMMSCVVVLCFFFAISPVLAQTPHVKSANDLSIVVVASPQFVRVVDCLISSPRIVVGARGFSEAVERDRNCSLDLLLAASLPDAFEDTVMKERLANRGVSVVVAPPPNRNCSFLSLIQWVRFVECELVSRYPEDQHYVKLRSKSLQKEILSNWRKASELPANWVIASANEL